MKQSGIIALHVGVLDDRVGKVETPGEIASLVTDVVLKPAQPELMGYVVPGLLKHYDIPDLQKMLE